MKRPCLFLLTTLFAVFSLLAQTARAGESPADYAYQAPLETQGSGPFFRLTLPLAVYRGTQSALRDVRIFNRAGEPLAHALAPAPSVREVHLRQESLPWFVLDETARENLPADILVRQDKDGALVSIKGGKNTVSRRQSGVLIDASAAALPLTTLAVKRQEGEALQHFTLEASDDLRVWQPVLSDGLLVRLEQAGTRIVRDRAEFPARRAKYWRLLWAGAEKPPQVEEVVATLSQTSHQPPDILWTEDIAAAAAPREGVFEYHLGAALPVERLKVLLPERNTLAPVRVQTPGDAPMARGHGRWPLGEAPARPPAPEARWRDATQGVAYRLTAGAGEAVAEDFALGGASLSEVRLVFGGPAGTMGSRGPLVRAGFTPQQVVFLARGDGPYVLAYGKAEAASAALPLATLVPGYAPGQMPGDAAQLAGPPVARPGAAPPPAQAATPPAERKWLLWSVLVAGVLVLLGMAWALLRAPQKDAGG